jgi:hypothetical protein
MAFSPSELSDIVARASGLDERLSDDRVCGGRAAPDHDVSATLAAWRENAAAGDDARFARRLAWAGLDLGTAAARLRPIEAPTPSWARTGRRVLVGGAADPFRGRVLAIHPRGRGSDRRAARRRSGAIR